MRYIDIHAHVFPENVASKAVETLEAYYNMKWSGNGLVSDLAENMNDAGVEKTVIFSTATKAAQVENINNYISGICSSDSRFIGFGTMHPEYENIEREISRFKELGLRGLKLHPDFQQFNIDDPKMFPIYEAIGDSMPILIHVGDENLDYSSPWRLAKVLDRLPHLNVIAAHLGGYTRWDEAKECLIGKKKLYLDVSSCFHRMSFAEGREIVKLHGAENILFASDYPAVSQKSAIESVYAMHLSDEENELIFYKNASSLLGI